MPIGTFSFATLAATGVVLLVLVLGGVGVIETGHVGVQKRFGTVALDELEPGLYVAPLADVRSYSAKLVPVTLDDLRPKAADNLFIRDFDVTVYYRVRPARIAEIEVKYAGMNAWLEGPEVWASAYDLVQTLTRNAAYQEVAALDSLTVHQHRAEIAEGIRGRLQVALDANDPDTFEVQRVVIRTVVTDPAIEAAIQAAVTNQKRLEAMAIAVEIAEREAEIRRREAEGIAAANAAINNTLTPAYLQHESHKVLMRFAERGGAATVVVPAEGGAMPLITVAPPTAIPPPTRPGAGARSPNRETPPRFFFER